MQKRVYPFRNGVDYDSNLVTLLGWADHLNIEPDSPNRYLSVMRSDPEAFASIERDFQRRTYSVRPFYSARIVAVGGLLLALIFVAVKLAINWRELDVRTSWALSIALWFVPSFLAAMLAVTVGQIAANFRQARIISGLKIVNNLLSESRREGANIVFAFLDDNVVVMNNDDTFDFDSAAFLLFVSLALITLPYTISIAVLSASLPIGWYLVLATAVTWLTFWLPATRACARSAIVYLRRPNRYVDVYEDSQSRHWVTANEKRSGG
jgi:hypothetical protein